MKTIPFNESARDVEHNAKSEVPDDMRNVLISLIGDGWDYIAHYESSVGWGACPVRKWRELPAPPKPAPKIVPHSLEHWHDPKVERPEPGRKFVVMCTNRTIDWFMHKSPDWDAVAAWTYCPETSR